MISSKENEEEEDQVKLTFLLSHLLQAEVDDSGTQAEANQCDRSLALTTKERRKSHKSSTRPGKRHQPQASQDPTESTHAGAWSFKHVKILSVSKRLSPKFCTVQYLENLLFWIFDS